MPDFERKYGKREGKRGIVKRERGGRGRDDEGGRRERERG